MSVDEHSYLEEDEINLLDLLMVLVRHKMLIIGTVFVCGVAAVVSTLMMTNIYRSEATITLRDQEKGSSIPFSALGGLGGMVGAELGLGGGGSLEKIEVILNSRALTKRVIEKHKLMPALFPDQWDEKKKKWESNPPPTLQDGCLDMRSLLSLEVEKTQGTINVAIEHEDPETAKRYVEYYIAELSEVLREEIIRDATENMRFFRKQLEKTSDTLLKEKIYTMLANEIEKDTFARAQKYYGFHVLDPPIVPEKKIKPKRRRICILSVVAAFFMAVFLAFIKEYVHRLSTDDKERFQEIVQGLKFGKKETGKKNRCQTTEDGRQK